jgi:hypothetical protein
MSQAVAFILAALKALPVLERLVLWMGAVLDEVRDKRKSEEMGKATEKAEHEKDTSGIEDIFNPKP